MIRIIIPKNSKLRGLGDAVSAVATPIAKALHLSCFDLATGELRPESECAKQRDALNAAVPFRKEGEK